MDSDSSGKFSPDYSHNQTDLILREEKDVGKSRLILNIAQSSEDDTKDIIIYFKRYDYFKTVDEDKVMIRYLSNENNEKFF